MSSQATEKLVPGAPEHLAKNMVIHWSDGEVALGTVDVWIYRFTYRTRQLTRLGRIPAKGRGFKARLRDFLARNPILQRFRPNGGICHAQPFPDGSILLIYDRIYLARLHGSQLEVSIIDDTPIGEYATPLRGGIAIHPESNKAYFGEYLNGHSRSINIYCIDPENKQVTRCWTFPRSEIKHVHAIHHDPYRNRLWVLTGDSDSESAFYYTDDEFKTLQRFAGGSQQWRAIGLLFEADAMEWGMDAGQDAPAEVVNRVFRYSFSTAQVEELAVIGNPAYAMVRCVDGGAVMATTFEPRRKQDTFRGAEIWHRRALGEWKRIAGFEYELHRRQGVSSYGMAYLPKGLLPAEQLTTTLINCKDYEYSNVIIDLRSRLLPLP